MSAATPSRPLKLNGTGTTHVWRPVPVSDFPRRAEFSFDSIEDALAAFAHGEPTVVMDDEKTKNTSGYVCISLPRKRLEALEIPTMVPDNQERHRTAYTIAVDYKHGTKTGIFAHDRSLTVRKLVDPSVVAADFTRPGSHGSLARARDGGVSKRRGHTECAIDLCTLTNEPEGGVLCELVNDDEMSTMSRRDDYRAFADWWGLEMISVEMLVRYRKPLSAPQDA